MEKMKTANQHGVDEGSQSVNQDEHQAFAARELGPASYRLVHSEQGVQDIQRRLEEGHEVSDVVLLCEHDPPVVTVGRGADTAA